MSLQVSKKFWDFGLARSFLSMLQHGYVFSSRPLIIALFLSSESIRCNRLSKFAGQIAKERLKEAQSSAPS